MKLYNKSARAHWLGGVLIAPMETKEVGQEWRGSYNKQELEEVKEIVKIDDVTEEPKPRGRKAKAVE